MNRTGIRNQQKFEQALLHLLKTRPFDMITVKDICDEAHLSRTTFYHHYERTDDVLLTAYEQAHREVFAAHSWTKEYFLSDEFIQDMIIFFDQNPDLLEALTRWNLLSQISLLPTRDSIAAAERMADPFLAAHADYATVYLWDRYFALGILWIRRDKKETKEELFSVMKYLRDLK